MEDIRIWTCPECGKEYPFDLFRAEENIRRAEKDVEYEPKFYCTNCYYSTPMTRASIRGHPPKENDE